MQHIIIKNLFNDKFGLCCCYKMMPKRMKHMYQRFTFNYNCFMSDARVDDFVHHTPYIYSSMLYLSNTYYRSVYSDI